MKGIFAEWYCKQVEEALSPGKNVEDIEIKFYLTVIKPLHAKWVMKFIIISRLKKVLKSSLMAEKFQESIMQSITLTII